MTQGTSRVECPVCKERNPFGARVCLACGAPLASLEEQLVGVPRQGSRSRQAAGVSDNEGLTPSVLIWSTWWWLIGLVVFTFSDIVMQLGLAPLFSKLRDALRSATMSITNGSLGDQVFQGAKESLFLGPLQGAIRVVDALDRANPGIAFAGAFIFAMIVLFAAASLFVQGRRLPGITSAILSLLSVGVSLFLLHNFPAQAPKVHLSAQIAAACPIDPAVLIFGAIAAAASLPALWLICVIGSRSYASSQQREPGASPDG